MRPPESSFTFVLIGDHSQDGTWPRPSAAPFPRGKPDWSRTSVSLSAGGAKVVAYGTIPSRARA